MRTCQRANFSQDPSSNFDPDPLLEMGERFYLRSASSHTFPLLNPSHKGQFPKGEGQFIIHKKRKGNEWPDKFFSIKLKLLICLSGVLKPVQRHNTNTQRSPAC